MIDLLRGRTGRLLVSGHRGARNYAPENTLAPFQKALETGADIIEFDVHLSRDKRCVVIHDDTLDRTTNGQGPVREMSWAEISRLDAGSWFDRQNEQLYQEMEKEAGRFANPKYIPPPIPTQKFAGERVPLLEDVLVWAKEVNMPVSIELKAPFPFYAGPNPYPDMVERVLEIIARYGDENNSHIHSFDHLAVLRVKELNPNIPTGISLYGGVLINPVGLLREARAEGVAIGSLWVTQELIETLHADQRNIFAWGWGEDPYNEEAELGRLVRMGIDYVSGGYPDLLRQVVEKYL